MMQRLAASMVDAAIALCLISASLAISISSAQADSPSGSQIPIVDASGNLWSAVVGGQITENGAVVSGGGATNVLLYLNGTIYTQYSGVWYTRNGAVWTAISGDPRSINGACGSANAVAVLSAPTTNLCVSGRASAVFGSGPWTWSCAGSFGGGTAQCSAPKISSSGATIPPAAQIIDTQSSAWTVSGGQIYRNGVVDQITGGVTLLLYYNGLIYQQTSSGAWYLLNTSTWPAGSSGWTYLANGDPRLALTLTPPSVSVPCNIPPGSQISTASTSGGDGNPISFSLSAGDITDFVIDSSTGAISVGASGIATANCNMMKSTTATATQP